MRYTKAEIKEIQDKAYYKFSNDVFQKIREAAESGESEIVVQNIGIVFKTRIKNDLENNNFNCYFINNSLKIQWY